MADTVQPDVDYKSLDQATRKLEPSRLVQMTIMDVDQGDWSILTNIKWLNDQGFSSELQHVVMPFVQIEPFIRKYGPVVTWDQIQPDIEQVDTFFDRLRDIFNTNDLPFLEDLSYVNILFRRHRTESDEQRRQINSLTKGIQQNDKALIIDSLTDLGYVTSDKTFLQPQKSEKLILKRSKTYRQNILDELGKLPTMCPRCNQGLMFYVKSPPRMKLIESYEIGQVYNRRAKIEFHTRDDTGLAFEVDKKLFKHDEASRVHCSYCSVLNSMNRTLLGSDKAYSFTSLIDLNEENV